MISIVLADDHHIVRQGLRALLELEPDFSIIGEVGDGLETVHLVEHLKPDVLIVDIMMPSLNGLEITRRISQRFPKTRVVILSMYTNESYVLESLKNGAYGYVVKCSEGIHLVQAVREATGGRRYLSPPLSDEAVKAYAEKAKETSMDIYETLTTREREVIQLLAEGYKNGEIAARLFISARTVEIHRANLMRKLGLRNYADLVRYALEKEILPQKDRPLQNNKKK